MATVLFRFYAELNNLLPVKYRFRDISQVFHGKQTVKHLLESLGIPHTEVDLILVNGVSVDFSYIPNEGDHISVYPVFETFDISNETHLRPLPLRDPGFVLDGHLGRLMGYLRMLGLDTLYRNDYSDEALAQISSTENRILLTRDRGLLKRSQVTHGYLLITRDPKQQLLAVIQRFDLVALLKPFTRCLVCNGRLLKVNKEDIIELLEPRTILYFEKFKRCSDCGKIYWRGSHYKHMLELIEWMQKQSRKKSENLRKLV